MYSRYLFSNNTRSISGGADQRAHTARKKIDLRANTDSTQISMSSSPSFADSEAATTRPFDDDCYLGYDPRLQSQRFDSFTNFADNESVKETDSPIFNNPSYGSGDAAFVPETQSPSSIYATSGGFPADQQGYSSFSPELNGKAFDEGFVASDGPILPPPAEMEPEDGFALREWRRQNAILLEEKEKKEKDLLNQIVDEADEYKMEFYRRRKLQVETYKSTNREKEKIFLAAREKFHAEVEKNYWQAIAELIPYEVVAIKKRGKKEDDKKPSVVVIQGPKPGKPTDLSRMRHILTKLKHNPPPNMTTSPPPPPSAPTKDAKTGPAAAAPAPKAVAVA